MRVTSLDLTGIGGESRHGGRVITLIGFLLSVVVAIDFIVRSDSVWFPEFVIEMTLSAMLVYVGVRLTRSNLDAKTLQKVGISCFKGMLALGVFAAGIIVAAKVSGWHISNPYFLTQTLVTSGALLGLVVGVAGMVAPLRTDPSGSGESQPPGLEKSPDPDESEALRLPDASERAVAPDEIQAPSGVVDDWLDVLADRNCRYVLRMAMNAPDGVITVEELTTADELRTVSLETDLRHITLPKLWDVHLIDYDDRTGTIRYDGPPAFEKLFETVERYRQ